MKRVICDVLVVGAGGSGLMAAIEASKTGARVAVASKGRALRSGATTMAPGALAAVDDRWKNPGDSQKLHELDTYCGGNWLNQQELVHQTVEKISGIILEMEEMGAIFERLPDGKTLGLRSEGGHTFARSPYMENRTGHEMMRALVSGVTKRNIPMYEEIMITEIVTEDNAVKGALGFEINSLEPYLFDCGAVILATGGAGMAYELNDNPTDLTGDGYALALSAGAQLMDMEFVQMYPMGFLSPSHVKGVVACYTFMPYHFYNNKGERFMKNYDPANLEKTTRSRLSQSMMLEVAEGRGSPLGGVFCDYTHCEPGFIKREFPRMYAKYQHVGIDPEKDMFEIAPTCHFFMGGAKVGENWDTRVNGLYSVGEAAAGVHGANRVGQNALSEIVVSASIAGKHAASYAKKASASALNPAIADRVLARIDSVTSNMSGERPSAIRKKLQKTMQVNAGVFRTEETLKAALKDLEVLEKTPVKTASDISYYNREVVEAIENENLLNTAKCVVRAALERKETRGAQYRHDYNRQDDQNWLKNIVLTKDGADLRISYSAVDFRYMKPEDQKL